NGDHGLAYRPAEVLLGDVLEAPQDDGRDFLWRVIASGKMDLVVAAHPTLDRSDRPFGVHDELVARIISNQQVAGFPDSDHRGQDFPPEFVDEYLGPAVAVHSDFRIGGAEVDSDDVVHHMLSPFRMPRLATITSAGLAIRPSTETPSAL